MFSLICVWINGWVNDREAGYLRSYRARDAHVADAHDAHVAEILPRGGQGAEGFSV